MSGRVNGTSAEGERVDAGLGRGELNPEEIRAFLEMAPKIDATFQSLRETNERLERQVERLTRDLEQRNRELEEKNRELEASLYEQQRLHHSLRSIVNSLHDGVIAADLEGRVTLFSRRAAELTGKTEEEVLGKRYTDVFEDHPPILLETIEKEKPQVQEFADYLGREGESPRQIEVTTALVRDDNDVLHGAVEVLRDLTERREMEEQLRRARVLAALGRVAVTIAHEIRNPLGAIQLRAEMLRENELSEAERQKAFDTIFSAIKLMDNTISNLLQFSRPVKTSEQFQNLSPLLDEALTLAEHAIRIGHVEIVRDYPPLGLMCHVDAPLFVKAVLNLLFNAIQATDGQDERTVTVSARRWEGDDAEPYGSHIFDGTPWIEVRIEDNGCGMPESVLEQIFTPFFTTKDDGVGLGLPIVHNIVEAHGGKMAVESTVGQGTCIRLMLPVYRPDVSHDAHPSAAATP